MDEDNDDDYIIFGDRLNKNVYKKRLSLVYVYIYFNLS